MPSTDAYVLQPGEAELRWLGETSTLFLATGESTGATFALVDETAPRAMTVPLHRHAADVESFYVIDGEVSFYLAEGGAVRVPAGGFVHIPPGEVHGFRVESETARYLILTTPQHGEFYRAITLPSGAAGGAPAEGVREEQIIAACERYGIEFVGPLPDSV